MVGEGGRERKGRWQRTSVLTPKNCLLRDWTDLSTGIGPTVLRGFAHSSKALTERQECSQLAAHSPTYCLWARSF